jgi:hypothetical protein
MSEAVEESVLWLYKMVITFVVAIIALFIVGSSITNELDTIELQKSLFLNRVLYSPDGFWYVDEQGVMHTGVVNRAEFRKEKIELNFNYPDQYGGALLQLRSLPSEAVNIDSALYIEESTYKAISGQVELGFEGAGTVETHNYPVLIKDGNREVNGMLTVRMAMPERS